ncbi:MULTISPECIES: protein-disulfide reductase DsbD family protein [Ramlibacter]|uniref:Protein-disulfide reductase n=1 Tax=Ramlibacter pinisoli TaxID=2682844 RepID=A0A6N8IWR4_9BURK|nr:MULTISPECIES: thioredoxin family protein [Ramlibacter]MBA2965460.1 thioredoxin family protein [Ramlibacter sp. CGMCC 1.13660]MVQ30426.1 protein-disulfide reductase [Ramlibacter pinisoli]
MPTLLHRLPRLLLAAWLFTLGLAAWAQGAAGGTVVTTERVHAELLAYAPDGLAPGKPVWVGLQLAHQPGWHTYWKNSGDSGLPTQLQWTLPAGVTAGPIDWPLPKKIPIGTLANYGYEDTVLLPVPLAVAPSFQGPLFGSDVEVKLRADWLVCRQECIPEQGEFTLKLPAKGSTALHRQAFEAAFAARPRPLLKDPGGIIPRSTATIDGQALELRVQGLPVEARGQQLEFFPETAEVIETAGTWSQAWNGAVWTARVPLSAQRSASPQPLPVVLAAGRQGWRTELQVLGAWPAIAAPAAVSPALQEALRANSAATGAARPSGPGIGLLAALVGALLGGVVLNLMPCVFPILAIKVVGFAAHAHDRRRHRVAGWAYTAGVVVSFLALGALVLGLRAAGEQLGWGFQLQSPLVVAALAALFTLIALNLAGLFEVGSLLPSAVASLEVRHPVGNAFLSGVLAVAVASPCTAPFMGASLGLAVTLPAAQALLVFACLGLGMALPYLLASSVPAVARLLPRPGAWMDVFRKLMAFPMFATVAWLVWVLGQQSGIDGAGALLVLLVALSLLVWTLTLRGRARGALAAVAVAALAALAWTLGPQLTQLPPAQAARAEGDWQPWSQARVEQLVAAGQPVFVDFTAAWCVTCQVNKKTTLTHAGVLADLKQRNVALLRADWTRRDPAITAALGALGRSGVPVYVFYRKGSPPVVLSELLGVDEVRQAAAGL